MVGGGGFSGSEHVVAENARSYDVGLQVLDMIEDAQKAFHERHGHAYDEINPTPGNKEGGITTLVEKSTGNIKKMGSYPVEGVLDLYDKVPRSGLWILNDKCQGVDAVSVSAYALSGAHLTIFSSGRGTPVGNAIIPVIKITGNPESYRKMKSMFDFNAGIVIDGADMDATGEKLYKLVIDVASGELTKSEMNRHFDFVVPYPNI